MESGNILQQSQFKKEKEKKKPKKITSGSTPNEIIGAIDNNDYILLDYEPPNSVIPEVIIQFNHLGCSKEED